MHPELLRALADLLYAVAAVLLVLLLWARPHRVGELLRALPFFQRRQ